MQEEEKDKSRKHIRKIMTDKKLTEETKTAAKLEEERRKRIAERQKVVSTSFFHPIKHSTYRDKISAIH